MALGVILLTFQLAVVGMRTDIIDRIHQRAIKIAENEHLVPGLVKHLIQRNVHPFGNLVATLEIPTTQKQVISTVCHNRVAGFTEQSLELALTLQNQGKRNFAGAQATDVVRKVWDHNIGCEIIHEEMRMDGQPSVRLLVRNSPKTVQQKTVKHRYQLILGTIHIRHAYKEGCSAI